MNNNYYYQREFLFNTKLITCVIPTLISLETEVDPLIISPVPFKKLEPPLKKPDKRIFKASSKDGNLILPLEFKAEIKNWGY